MRVGPFELRRAPSSDATVTAAAATPKERPEVGASGTVNQGGFLFGDEYNSDLAGARGLQTWRRMRHSDASVREALWHIFAPLLDADWDIDPASDDPLDLEIREFVNNAYFVWPVEPFEQTMAQTLLYLAQGVQVFELPLQVVEAELQWTDHQTRETVTAARRQFLTWKRWAHRRPETIVRWNIERGELVSVVQNAFKGDSWQELTIPAEDLAVFTNEKEGDDFTGVSILRSAYKAWYMKEVVEKVGVQAIETHGLGLLNAYLPANAVNDERLAARVEDILRDVRANGNTYAVWPFPKAQSVGTSETGGTVEYSSPQGGVPDFTPFLEYQRGEIKGNVLARFAELGHGSTGARATGDVQSEVWYSALHATAMAIAGVHQQAIRRLVLANYQTDRFPTLVARNIEAKSLLEFADANAKLTSAGAIIVDKSYREFVRQGVGAPDEDETDETPPEEDQPLEDDPTDLLPPEPPG